MKKFLLHPAFSVGCKWGAEHTFRSEVLPSCPLYPNLQVNPVSESPWTVHGFHKLGLKVVNGWRSAIEKENVEDDHFFSQYVKAGSGQDSKWIRGSMKKE